MRGKDELPWYVYKKDIQNNVIYVCQGVNNKLLMNSALHLDNINFINNIDYKYPLSTSIQVRHQHKPVNCIVSKNNDGFFVEFDSKIRAVAPGQSAVFYNKDICLGGGVISKTL